MIKQHFQNELVKCGYPDDLTIEYSLGYCQGDGVAFYGDLSVDDVKALMNRLFSTEPGQVDAVSRVKNLMAQKDIENMLSVLREYGSCDLSITRNSHGHHYSHWNCMNIDDKPSNRSERHRRHWPSSLLPTTRTPLLPPCKALP